jgi:hypothetical protein
VQFLEDHLVHGEGACLVRQQVRDPAQLLRYGGRPRLRTRNLLVPTLIKKNKYLSYSVADPGFAGFYSLDPDPDPVSGMEKPDPGSNKCFSEIILNFLQNPFLNCITVGPGLWIRIKQFSSIRIRHKVIELNPNPIRIHNRTSSH